MQESAFAYNLIKDSKPKLVILKDNSQIDDLAYSLEFFKKFFNKNISVETLYSYEIPPISSIPPSSEITSGRIKAIYSIINKSDNVVVLTNINALLQPVISEEDFFDKFMSLSVNSEASMTDTVKKLFSMYYIKKDFVEEYGDFAKRGDILDVFSPLYDKPARIEFFSDDIESIKLFFVANQRTYRPVKSIEIPPAREYKTYEDNYGYLNLKRDGKLSFLSDYENIWKLKSYKNFDEHYVDEVLKSLEIYKKTYNEDIYLDYERLRKFIDSSEFLNETYELDSVFPDNLTIDEKINRIKELSKNHKIVIACASSTRAERVGLFLDEKRVSYSKKNEELNGVYLSELFIKKGFFDKKKRLAVVSFEDLFGKTVKGRTKTASLKKKIFLQDSKVVHKSHGIGIYRGIRKIDVEKEEQDFIEIEYANKDKLYVPIYNSDSIFEYHGSSELSVLGSNRWKNTQDNIKKSIKKILSELVNTYAKRQLAKREPFVVDSLEYKEFEALFEYEETKDQAKAIKDIKNDMQLNSPMDRLVCGDVSFGKTEVAMRAAAISVFNERQVVFMAPTTVLSLQHYKTFIDRFSKFPVNIALLNRFSTKKEKEDIFDKLKKGIIDILICTHSVYSEKIKFADLGLVVIDEEHRFGVKIKEHLKSKYPYVDMLYLSATPIPRTLNMALNNIFDISVIKTPPLERKPIETFVLKRKKSVIRDAVLKELSRKGSIYFVHNNIETIEDIQKEIEELIPFARKSIIHAKMPKKAIKSTIEAFNKREFDILISTSIIESGLDIKNVNTIIIDNADRFGLSDLYQLRGRVGRGDRTAYAYLLINGKITDDARKRLYFMKEFVERGVGFNLALKDMEIRGGGNILGKDQSGSIKSIGFGTYASLVEEAISEIKNMPIERDVEIRCSYPAYVSDDFADEDNKFRIYKMIYAAKNHDELEDIKNEVVDTFGKLPKEVENLFLIASLKIYAKRIFLKSLSISKNGVLLEFYVDADIDTQKLIKTLEKNGGRFISETSVFFDNSGDNLPEIYDNLKNILQCIT